MRAEFDTLCDDILGQLRADEDATLNLRAEASDFVRFNRGRVRQPGHVRHGMVSLRLLRGQRHAAVTFNVSGDRDLETARAALDHLRGLLEVVPEDPHLLWEQDGESTSNVQAGTPATGAEIVETIVDAARDLDLVGILASGEMATGFASSRGQRNWDQKHGWLFDWCLYAGGDKAVKSTLGGSEFHPEKLRSRIASDSEQLEILTRPARRLEPGDYRVYLTPSAMGELLDLVSSDGFSLRAHRSHSSSLERMAHEGARLSPRVHLSEDVRGGLAPGFSEHGFSRPGHIPLVSEGALVGALVSPRSAREYGQPTNGTSTWEAPDSLAMSGGDLPEQDAMKALGTGLYISNLWYLNYSDHTQGRITGMTRFATLWVEDGVPVAPTEVMRFDDTLFHLLGEGLEDLTREVSMLPSTQTYGMRSASSQRVPGALIRDMTFTL